MAALAQEITAEIDQEILASLRTLAGTAAETYNQAAVSGTATFVGDEHAALAVQINRVANLISARTRRGAGNYAVVFIYVNNPQKSLQLQRSQEQQKVLPKLQLILKWLEHLTVL